MKRICYLMTLAILSLMVLVWAERQAWEADVSQIAQSHYAIGVADGTAQTTQRFSLKAPAAAQAFAESFCSGAITLSMFAPAMGLTQAEVDSYVADPHVCASTRYLGSVPITNTITGDLGTDYIFILDANGTQVWWVFTLDSNGKVAQIQ